MDYVRPTKALIRLRGRWLHMISILYACRSSNVLIGFKISAMRYFFYFYFIYLFYFIFLISICLSSVRKWNWFEIKAINKCQWNLK